MRRNQSGSAGGAGAGQAKRAVNRSRVTDLGGAGIGRCQAASTESQSEQEGFRRVIHGDAETQVNDEEGTNLKHGGHDGQGEAGESELSG